MSSLGRPLRSVLGHNGSTRRWREIRDQIMERDRHRCRYCGARATTVDHVRPRRWGGDDAPSNLVACCVPCQSPINRPRSFKTGLGPRRWGVSVSTHSSPGPTLSGDYSRSDT